MTTAVRLPRLRNGKRDRRYSIAREYCGYSKAQWVVRFCGHWIGRSSNRRSACAIAVRYQAAFYALLDVTHSSPLTSKGTST